MKNINIVDEKGRPLLKIKNGRVLISRFDTMSLNTKKVILNLYKEICGKHNSELQEIIDFLNYKKKEEFEFCS